MRRVVVTGLGIVAPTGNCVDDAWEAALAARSAVAPITQFDASSLPVQIAAEVRGFDATSVMGAKESRQASRFIQFAVGAVRQAVDDSGLDRPRDRHECGCIMGVGIGALGNIEQQSKCLSEHGPRRVSPLLLPYAIPNMAAGVASIWSDLKGPCFGIASACASGTHAVGEAALHISAGKVDVMVAGGVESACTPLLVASFARMRALSTRNDTPTTASRPFDLDRDGFVIGEGSAALVLEEYEHARRRGARIYAELVGYGATADAFHITTPPPEGDGIARAMAAALKQARIDPDSVDYINAHGTSTQANDMVESAAIEMVLGEHARKCAISSTKGVTGHCLGAAGAIEAVYTVLAIVHGIVPPTANLERPDPSCRLDYTPKESRKRRIRFALSNSCGFGGQNACLAFKRCD